MKETITVYDITNNIISRNIGIERQYTEWLKPSNGIRKAYNNISPETITYFLNKFSAKAPITYRNHHESTFLLWLLKRPPLTSLFGIETELKTIFTTKN
jgi:hypothetical protein